MPMATRSLLTLATTIGEECMWDTVFVCRHDERHDRWDDRGGSSGGKATSLDKEDAPADGNVNGKASDDPQGGVGRPAGEH